MTRHQPRNYDINRAAREILEALAHARRPKPDRPDPYDPTRAIRQGDDG